MSSSNEDEEPKVCTVFSSAAPNSSSKTIFDTIAFSAPKKEPPETSVPSLLSADTLNTAPTSAMSKTNSMVSIFADDLQSGDHGPSQTETSTAKVEGTSDFPAATGDVDASSVELTWPGSNEEGGEKELPAINLYPLSPELDISGQVEALTISSTSQEDDDGPLPTATSLFADRPEVPFPVNIGVPVPSTAPVPAAQPVASFFVPNIQQPSMSIIVPVEPEQPQPGVFQQIVPDLNPVYSSPPPVHHTFSSLAYTTADKSYDIWIPSEETQQVLASVQSDGSNSIRVPDKAHMTMPGVISEEEMMDKVGINISRLFGDAEASRRRILTADNVTQDDNGIRELIKLGCYRSAINLTKRLLILYGQGPGKVGHFSKHTPHSLQLWFTRISLLVRIREFSIADSELEAFRNFDSPDLFYEYYPPECFGCTKTGSLVPFHFRLLAAEIPQYMRRFSDTIDKLSNILFTVQKILKNVEATIDPEERARALAIWRKREIRVLYSLANSSLFSKDYYNGFNFLNKLCQMDSDHLTELKSATGRLFLQHGDLTTAQHYFQEAADLRSAESESDQVDTLVDSALVSMSQNIFPEALVVLKQAALLQPDNFMITNNMSVCLLYMGKVKESLALMEATVRQNIPQSLQENVILNLSSMYELENSDGVKKLSLLKLISEYKGDGINLASLKMPNLV